MEIVIAGVIWAAFVGLGLYVAGEKHRPLGEAWVLTLIFGPFGVLIIALLPTVTYAERAPMLRKVLEPDDDDAEDGRVREFLERKDGR